MIDRIGADVTRELGRFAPASGLAPLVDAWPSAVGPEIARNAWPARIARDGTLHVHASSSAWAFELAQLEPRIRSSLGELAPPRLRFVVGPLPEPSRADAHAAETEALSASESHRRRAAEIAAPIGDQDLRKVVAKTAALSLAKADSDRMFW